MCREIKFRCWQLTPDEDWEMIEAENLAFENYEPLVQLLKSHKNSEIFMQYTGLKDKKGVEIYEGDISKDALGRVYKIVFHHGSFWLQMINGTYSERLHSNRQIEVIGNIYQNPELLNN